MFEAWDAGRTFARHVTAAGPAGSGRLTLTVERLRKTGRITIVDQARPSARGPLDRAKRSEFAEVFRVFLRRQFPGFTIPFLSAEPDLEESLSPAFPRALVKQGTTAWAAIAAPPAAHDDHLLTFGLIWLDYLRLHQPRLALAGLALFLPQGKEKLTALRLAGLHPCAARYLLFSYDGGHERPYDPGDTGNVYAALPPCSAAAPGTHPLDAIAAMPGVECVAGPHGALSFRVRGLEFARHAGGRLRYGLDRSALFRGERQLGEIRELAAALERLRRPGAPDEMNPLYTRNPEAWLECNVRRQAGVLDPALEGSPLYSQLPARMAGDRGIIDLLAADRTGRLAVLELKASADPHLPVQALDYWLRVRHHVEAGDFARLGYFPGLTVRPAPPRLLLIAPALEFHSTTETILRYFHPEIEVHRIGLHAQWRRELKIASHLTGRGRPA